MDTSPRRILALCSTVVLLAILIYPGPSHAQQGQSQTAGTPQFDDDPPPVGDQVPCILTNKQNYSARSLIVPAPPTAANVLAQAADTNAARIEVAQGDTKAEAQKKANTKYAQILREHYSTYSFDLLKKALSGVQAEAVSSAISDIPDAQKPAAADAAQSALPTLSQISTTFQRPKDVSCSMSILSWDEAHKALGRTIADTYIAVQVTVRNLDGNNEFLIQDAELAVDANSAQLSRFQVGHEKELARGVLQYGQSYDRQHVFINIVDGIGTILGAVVPIPQPSIDALTGATGAYHAGLMPGLHTLFPDLTTRNLNTLNDLAFSAASASRIVVPKSGSVPFVVFIAVKPLEQACWLQPGYDFYRDTPLTPACDQVCKDSACTNEKLLEVRFKHWTPVQVQALEAHAYALIAGTHIKAAGQPAVLNSLVCAAPTDSAGAYLQYALPASGLTCTLSGSDLDTMTALRLRSAADAKTNLDAKVTVSGDNTTATAVLASADASKIQQSSYELYGVDKSGTEHDLNRAINFRLPPSITSGQSVPAAGTATLSGSNLTGVSQVVFYDATDATEIARSNVTNTAIGSITFSVPIAAALPAGPAGSPKEYAIRLLLADGANTLFDTKTTVKR